MVGLPSEVILCRDQSESPAIQLSRATEYLHLGSTTPSKMCFSFNASGLFQLTLLIVVFGGTGRVCDVLFQEESLGVPHLQESPAKVKH